MRGHMTIIVVLSGDNCHFHFSMAPVVAQAITVLSGLICYQQRVHVFCMFSFLTKNDKKNREAENNDFIHSQQCVCNAGIFQSDKGQRQ